MIAIVNIGGDPLGDCRYEVRINKNHIAFFEHSRPDGLAKCLQEAAKAVEKAKWEEIATHLLAIEEIGGLAR